MDAVFVNTYMGGIQLSEPNYFEAFDVIHLIEELFVQKMAKKGRFKFKLAISFNFHCYLFVSSSPIDDSMSVCPRNKLSEIHVNTLNYSIYGFCFLHLTAPPKLLFVLL